MNFYGTDLAKVESSFIYSENEMFQIKLRLLSAGLTLSEQAKVKIAQDRKQPQSVRSGASSGLDLILPGFIWVNAPIYDTNPNSLTLDCTDEAFILYDTLLTEPVLVSVLPEPAYYKKMTSCGEPMRQVGQIFADRIGFGLINQCYFWKKERRCAFCTIGKNTTNELATKSAQAILETLKFAIDDSILPPKHILLSGGTFPHNGWTCEPFAKLAHEIRRETRLPIYLMAVPPADLGELDALYQSGINEIAFNIEIYDEKIADNIIPGKHREVGLQRYLHAIKSARRYWSRAKVRSLLVAGLESMEKTLEGVKAILDAGGTPILSAFRPLQESKLSALLAPKAEWFEQLHAKAKDLAARYDATLGPECNACKANCIA